MRYMRMDFAYEFYRLARFGQVGVIHDQTVNTAVFLRWILTFLPFGLLTGNHAKQLAVYHVEYLAPVDKVAVQKVVEHVFLAAEKTAKCAGLVLKCVLHTEKWEHKQKGEYLPAVHLAVIHLAQTYRLFTDTY